MKVWQRYFLLQIPGWVLAAAGLWAAVHWLNLPSWVAIVAWAAYFLKDFLLYPYLRHAFEDNTRSGVESMIGATGIVQQAINPTGYVRVRGELWQAQAEKPDQVIDAGTKVQVAGANGMLLIVREITRG